MEFIKLSITDTFKNKASEIDFTKLNKTYPNQLLNVNETKNYLPLYCLVCALFYYETGILLSYHNNFYGYYSNN